MTDIAVPIEHGEAANGRLKMRTVAAGIHAKITLRAGRFPADVQLAIIGHRQRISNLVIA